VELTPGERRRYGRHVVIPEVGEAGQLRLKAGSALVVGAGGLGSPTLLYLAAAGLGRIGIVEFDEVDESNLAGRRSRPPARGSPTSIRT
jgi:molybdopterin/thiamine biosynthesis adenylyltransferase